MEKTPIGIMGQGYVGSALAGHFFSAGYRHGHDLFVYDTDPKKGYADLATLNKKAEIVFVCVPTDFHVDNPDPKFGYDMTSVRKALGLLRDGKTVVLKSTVLPGTCDALAQEYPTLHVLFNPEFLSRQTAAMDMANPDRQIMGYTTETSKESAIKVLELLPKGSKANGIMPAKDAEGVKIFGNALFFLKVIYGNAFFDYFTAIEGNYYQVAEGASADPRTGGPVHFDPFHGGNRGVGGPCLPKDTQALLWHMKRLNVPTALIEAAVAENLRILGEQGITRKD